MARMLAIFVGDEDEDERRKIADVDVAADDRLTLVRAEPEFADRVKRALAEMNAADRLFRIVPAAADAPRYALEKALAVRGDPDFLEAIRDNLERYHGLNLADA